MDNHRTHEQDVIDAKARIAELKAVYLADLEKYISVHPKLGSDGRAAVLACQKSGTGYFNYAEEFVGNSDLLGAHRSPLWAQGFAEDCAEILLSLPGHVTFLKDAFRTAGIQVPDATLIPGRTAYANMQRMVVKYLTPDAVNEVKGSLVDAKLSTYGFRNHAKEFVSKNTQIYLAFSFGVVTVFLMIGIALLKPNPTGFQYSMFKTVMALAGAAVGVVIPGFLEVSFRGWLRAGGALALFVLLYFFVPAKLESTSSPLIPASPSVRVN